MLEQKPYQTKATRTHVGARNLGPRRDPRPRSTLGTPVIFEVVNKDPNRKYVLAAIGDVDTGQAYYEALGYEVEPYRGPDAPHLRAVSKFTKDGSLQTYRGHVLMSVDKEIWDEDVANGQKMANDMERAIRGRVGLLEGEARLFGRGGAIAVEVQSDASPEVSELVTE
jgi:hypothetical protein